MHCSELWLVIDQLQCSVTNPKWDLRKCCSIVSVLGEFVSKRLCGRLVTIPCVLQIEIGSRYPKSMQSDVSSCQE